MRAYLVDPTAREVREVNHDGDFRDVLKRIEADSMDAASLAVSGGVKVTVYVDDGGYYVADQAWWTFKGYPHPLPGRGLVVGTDYKGDTTHAPVTATWLDQRIGWLGRERPHLPDIVIQTRRGVKRIDMNGPDAPKTKEEAAARINKELDT